jgi:lysophospholipase L1-like esterase
MNIIFKRVSLSLFSIFICLIILEFGIRIISKNKPDKIEKIFDRGDYVYRSSSEQLHPWTKGVTNKLTVLVIGDSIANGSGVQPYDRFANRLEAYLNCSPDTLPAEVFLFAKGGLSTEEEYNAYIRKAIELKPDIMILSICLNDAEDAGNKTLHEKWRKARMPKLPPKWLAPILKPSKILSLIYIKAEYMRCQKATRKYYKNLYNEEYRGWQKMKSAILDFKKACEQENIQFLAVLFASVSVTDKPTYPFLFAHEKIAEVMKEGNIQYIDLLDLYKGKSSMRLQALPGLDAHPNEIAHNMAAVRIFETLVDKGYISDKYVYSKAEPYSEEFWKYLFERMRNPIDYFFNQEKEN